MSPIERAANGYFASIAYGGKLWSDLSDKEKEQIRNAVHEELTRDPDPKSGL